MTERRDTPTSAAVPQRPPVLISDYLRDRIAQHLGLLALYAAEQGTTLFAYEDAAVSFADFKPFDPKPLAFARKSIQQGQPWAFFVAGPGKPEALAEPDKKRVQEALGRVFPLDILKAAVKTAEREAEA